MKGLYKGRSLSASVNWGEGYKLINKIPRPTTKLGRTIVGSLLIIGGILGFLPILGFWMVPLGLIILSQDFAPVRRFRRRWSVRFGRWWENRKQHIKNQ